MPRRRNLPLNRKQISAIRRRHPAQLRVELLEDRCVPASTSTFAGGVLTINGDATATAQNVTIAEIANSPGTYAITVTDNGVQAVSTTLGNITSIVINPTNGGADTINLNGSITAGTTLTGNLTINPTNKLGNLTVNIGSGGAGFNVNGATTINDAGSSGFTNVTIVGQGTSLGTTSITTGNGASNITLDTSAGINGAFSVVLGAGNDTVNLGLSTGGDLITGAVNVTGGGGTANTVSAFLANTGDMTVSGVQTVSLDSTTVNGNLTTFNTGSNESDEVILESFNTIQGYVSINVASSSSLYATVADTSIKNFFSGVSGSGIDDIEIDEHSSIGTNFAVNVGASTGGSDFVEVNEGSTVGGNVLVTGTGNLTFELGTSEGASVGGFVSLNETGSNSTADVTVGSSFSSGITSVGGFVSVVASGNAPTTGSDSITVNTASIGGTLGADLGAGTATVNLDNTNIGGNVFVDGTGNLTFEAQSTSFTGTTVIGGFVSLNETGSMSTVSVTTGTDETVTVGGFFSVVATGTGNLTDSINLTDTNLGSTFGTDLSAGNNNVTMDSVTLTGGNVFVNAPGAANMTFDNVTAPGSLNLINGGGNYIIAVESSAFGGASITTTTGNENLTFSDSIFNGNVTINQGGTGNDSFNVEANSTQSADSIGTQFKGAVSYTSSAPNDTVTLGASATDLAVFYSAATFTSIDQPGDSITFKSNAVFNGPQPTITGFPNQS
jgi:hypothetical protein